MKIDDIAKQLANKVNQEHYIKHYLEKVQRGAYNKGVKDAETKQLILSGVRHPLPDANKLYKMAETIVSKQVVIFNTPKNEQIDWEELKNDWFDWLNEKIKGNCA